MGSEGRPKSWTPNEAYKDCARGICNIYCREWCNYPAPLDTDDDSNTTFSPLIIAVIGILASAFLLVSYYAIITKCWRRRRGRRNPNLEAEASLEEVNHDRWQVGSSGLDEGLIKSITVFKYKKGDGLVEGTDCSVCLSEFEENDNLRLLPKCCHAFHPPCIDTWLKSHSNCPLCRANAAPFPLPSLPAPSAAASNPPQNSSNLHISPLETTRQNDLVLVIEEEEVIDHQEFAVNVGHDVLPKFHNQVGDDVENPEMRNKKIPDQDESTQLRRSSSLGTFLCQRGLRVADVVQMNEDDEGGIKVEIQQQLEIKIGSSKRVQVEESKPINGGRESDS